MNKAILIIPIIAILLSITTSTTTAVQARSGDGFDDGYAKGKFDITHGQPLNDTCLSKGLACDQSQSGYITAVNQYAYHCKLCVPNNMTLLIVNKTGSIPGHTADGYIAGYNNGRSNTLNNQSFSELCQSTRVYCDDYKRGYITGWVEMHIASGTQFDMKLLNANETA
jgi:hypothetical protein